MLPILVTFVVGLALAWFGEARIIDIRTSEAYAELSDTPHDKAQKAKSNKLVFLFLLVALFGVGTALKGLYDLYHFIVAQTWAINFSIHF